MELQGLRQTVCSVLLPKCFKKWEEKELWIKALKRENKDKTAWLPGCSDRVCSIHFIDGIPTAANPVPTLHLGYEKEVPKSRRELFRQPLQKKRKERRINKH